MGHTITRVFMNGNSQAVRIPQEFRLQASQVRISQRANGDLVLHPLPPDRGAAMLKALHGFGDELSAELALAVQSDRRAQRTPQERDTL